MKRNIDALFFCTTPYQIIAGIALKKSLNISADLYITDQQLYYKEAAGRIEKLGIFDAVRIIPWFQIKKTVFTMKKKQPIIWGLMGIKAYCSVDWVAEKSLIPDTEYKAMFASTRNLIGRLIWYHFIKHDCPMDFYYFDDGEASYHSIEKIRRVSKTDAVARTILFGKKSVCTDYPQYLYSPELYRAINPNKNIEIRKIPNILDDPQMKEIINTIYDFPEDGAIRERVIYIDTVREENKLGYSSLDQMLQQISECFGTDNIMVKKHPRDKTPAQDGYHVYKYNGLPFESICLNSDISSKVVIAVRSTAAITPKLMLDQEPHVIALYKILGDYTEKMDQMYRACKALYQDPERFAIPETMDELSEVLMRFRQE